jgi:hypothetical protein
VPGKGSSPSPANLLVMQLFEAWLLGDSDRPRVGAER